MQVKVKDFASEHGVATETIYKKIRKKPPELDGHVSRSGGATWLDDAAQDYLASTLAQSPLVVSDNSLRREIDQLRADNQALAARAIDAQDKALAALQRVNDLQQTLGDTQLLLAQAQNQIAQATAQAEPAKKPWWQRIFSVD